jgi:2'-5' RNA ligase
MVQSVEALLAPDVEDAVRGDWQRLAEAGLPSLQRKVPVPHHRPHLTLWAGDSLGPDAETALKGVTLDEELPLVVGPVMIFGPHPRRGCILVRLVVPSVRLLTLQRAVIDVCGRGLGGQFDSGRWVPHVTLARRLPVDQLGAAVAAMGRTRDFVGPCSGIRRWDGAARQAWSLHD